MIYVLGGGASKGAIKKGTIVVTYPSGATCTVTNDSKTYTALDTSGTAAFAVDAGTWTVTITDGSNTASQSVTVTAAGWVSVELSLRVPSAYQEVEYLEATGTQYINTGVKNASTNRIQVKMRAISDTNGTRMYGAMGAPSTYPNSFYCQSEAGGTLVFGTGASSNVWKPTGYTAGTDLTIDHNGNVVTVNGTSYTLTAVTFSTDWPVYLMAAYFNLASSNYLLTEGSKRLYYAKIYQSGTLVRDLIPCYRKSDSVAGMWDAVGETFYTNAGTGTFTVGGNV